MVRQVVRRSGSQKVVVRQWSGMSYLGMALKLILLMPRVQERAERLSLRLHTRQRSGGVDHDPESE